MGKAARSSVLVLATLAVGLSLSRAATDSSPAKPDYSKEAAVIESSRTAYRFDNNGKTTEDVTARVKIQSPAGVQQYGVLTFTYPSASVRPEIDYVRVRQPDGTLVTTPPSSFQDVTPDVTRAAPEYSDFRQKQVAVKGLIPGSELEYHARFQTFAPLVPGQFWLAYDFTENAILLDEELQVSVPQDRALKLQSALVQPTITTEGGRRVYLWKHSNPKVIKQRLYPAGRLPPPDVLLSSFQSWAEVGAWWRQLERPQAAPTDAIRAKAAELTKGLTTQQQKLQAIYSYVAQQFRYISISFGIGRYQPHSAGQVLANGYGDCKDKETLLASLLQAVGIKAWPALINSQQRLDPDVPSPGQFDHAISVMPEGKDLQWMDTTTMLAPLGLLTFNLRGKQALVIPNTQPAYLAETPVNPSVPNRVTFRADGKLASDGTYTGKMQYTTDGDTALAMRLIFSVLAQSQWEKVVQAISRNLGFGGEVSGVEVSSPQDTAQPFTITYNYVRKNYSDWEHQKQIVAPLPMTGPQALPDRDDKSPPQPFILGAPEEDDFRARVELPKGYTPEVPKPLDLTTPFAAYHSISQFQNGVLTTERHVSTTADQVPIAQLDAYRKFQKAASKDVTASIALNTKGGPPTLAAEPPSPEFRELIRKAYNEAYQQNERGALDDVNRALKLDPGSELAWLMAASLHMDLLEHDEAIAAARKAVSLAPQDFRASLTLARLLWATGRQDEVIPVWREFVQRNPQNAQGHAILASNFVMQKKYSEAVSEYDTACKLDPKEWRFDTLLADALTKAGDMKRAAVAYENAADLHPTPEVWNGAAYTLAQANLNLPKAEDFALRAVKAQESRAGKIALENLSDGDLRQMPPLAAYWDTVGWVYFREGKLEEARKYCAASFTLEQNAIVADHWGQIDEKLGHRLAAIREEAMAVSLGPSIAQLSGLEKTIARSLAPALTQLASQMGTTSYEMQAPEARQHLIRLTGPGARFNAALSKARDELNNLRTYRIGKTGLKPGSADFFLLLAPGEKAAKVKFISGSASLRAAAERLAAVQYPDPFPDDGPAKLLRRGVLTCSEGISTCDFVLLAPESVHSVE